METRIREIRAERGWTVRRLAEESGVDKNTISGVERRKRKPNPITMHKLAEALGVEVRELFPLGQAPLPLEPGAATQPEGTLDAPIVKQSVALGALRLKAELTAPPEVRTVLEDVRDHKITVEEAERIVSEKWKRILEEESRVAYRSV